VRLEPVKRFDYQGVLYPIGVAVESRIAGWELAGSFIRQADDGNDPPYQLALYRRPLCAPRGRVRTQPNEGPKQHGSDQRHEAG